ncbi:hypothetical protein PENANT_c026G05733 [Penicillium antarcticum]|uniref:Uncharacterized protein n=1 Tax=Penicillium antarcticum TaxID=416450 RepID=A0A1V6PX83_9EURO|nr:hypothetical protein PENANT_c026G05733 [Penicillium antarcticum]
MGDDLGYPDIKDASMDAGDGPKSVSLSSEETDLSD